MLRQSFSKNPLHVFVLLVLLTLGLYGQTIHYEFCNDDKIFILQNVFIKHFSHVRDIWYGFNTRFLAGLSFAFNYWLGGLNVVGYRLFNLAIHILNAFLVYRLVILTFRTPRMASSHLRHQSSLIAFWAALIFLAHPIQIESVTYISQRITAMATFFYLGTILFYAWARLENQPFYLLGAYLSMVLGIFTKEMVISAPFAVLIYELYFFMRSKNEWSRLFLVFLPFIFLISLLLLVFQMDRSDSLLRLKYQIAGAFNWKYLFTEINVMRTYLRLLVLPVNQLCDYEYPIVQSFFQVSTLFSFFLLGSLLVFALWQFPDRRFLSFSIIWFFIATAVEAVTVCFVHKGVIYEHWLYLPMVGFAIFLPLVIFETVTNTKKVQILLFAVLCLLSVLTFERNKIWRTELTLWEDVIRKDPNNYRSYAIVGVYYSRLGRLNEAIASDQKALQYFDKFTTSQKSQLLINLGAVYGKRGDYDNEIKFNQNALRYNPNHPQAYSNIGYAYTLLGDFKKGLEYGKKAVEIDPRFAEAHNNLGVTLVLRGELKTALQHFERALELNPDYKEAKANMKLARDLLAGQK